ncbi:uncharacterized protein [Periplaneta americana]|uniref:uncharacterized protein n=1 Tax=Periplaneta americana TaxID=6978 RepID=UPI0037E78FA1
MSDDVPVERTSDSADEKTPSREAKKKKKTTKVSTPQTFPSATEPIVVESVLLQEDQAENRGLQPEEAQALPEQIAAEKDTPVTTNAADVKPTETKKPCCKKKATKATR